MKILNCLACLLVISAGCGNSDVCNEASAHVAMCTSSEATPMNSCNAAQATMAEDLLAMECHEIELFQSSSKAEVASNNKDLIENVESSEFVKNACDPQETTVCRACLDITVEFKLFGLMDLGSCLIKAKCEFAEEGVGLCSCTWIPGTCEEGWLDNLMAE